jgi:hypothetical protein
VHTNNKDQFEDTKRVIESRKSKDRQHNGQKVEDTKRVIESRKSKDRQHNGQKVEDQTDLYCLYALNRSLAVNIGKIFTSMCICIE